MPAVKALVLVLSVAVCSSQTCPSWKSKNTAPLVREYAPVTTMSPDPNWPGAVGGGTWGVSDFPEDPRNGETNQNFTWRNSNPQPYVYIDHQDPNGQQKFDTLWATQNMSLKLAENPVVRPAGYKYAFIRAFNKNIPCVRVSGATGHGLEIAVFAQEDHRICIRDVRNAAQAGINNQANVAFTTVCAQQRVKHCFVTPNDAEVNFEIYADTPYELTNGFGVFYRMRRSRYAYVQSGNEARTASTEMWCMMLNGIDWPEFTGATPQNGLDIPRTNGVHGLACATLVIMVGHLLVFVAVI